MRASRIAAVGAATLIAVFAPSSAWGASETRVVEGEHLRLVSTLDRDAAADLAPGESIDWLVDIGTTRGERGEITASLEGVGELAVDVAVHRCDVAWRGGACATGEDRLRPLSPVARDGSRHELARSVTGDTVHLRLVVAAPDALRQGEQTEVRVVAGGFGEEVDVGGPTGELAATGGTGPWPIVFGAFGALAVGAVLVVVRRTRRAER